MPVMNFATAGSLPDKGLTFAWPKDAARGVVNCRVVFQNVNAGTDLEPNRVASDAWELTVVDPANNPIPNGQALLNGVTVAANYGALQNPSFHKGPNAPSSADKIPESWWVSMVTTVVAPNAITTLNNLPANPNWLAVVQ